MKNSKISDSSGSWANIALFVENIWYVANVGDSRAILSMNKGKLVKIMSIDHKPNNEQELNRIMQNGGSVYQTHSGSKNICNFLIASTVKYGPHRILPGRLSVSRAFGDIEAKNPDYGGNPNVLIASPDIKSFEITNKTDFLVLGSDGIFEKLQNEEIIQSIWETQKAEKKKSHYNFHEALGECADMILK